MYLGPFWFGNQHVHLAPGNIERIPILTRQRESALQTHCALQKARHLLGLWLFADFQFKESYRSEELNLALENKPRSTSRLKHFHGFFG